MGQPGAFYQWFKEVGEHRPQLSKPQAQTLAAFSFGLGLARRCTLSLVAEALAFLGKPDTVERRLQRFLSNQRISWQEGAQALAPWVLASWTSSRLVLLLVDQTSWHDKMKVMALTLADRRRAIPLAWWCYHQESWPMGQVERINTLFRWVAPGIPPDSTVLVQADRGIGTSPDLLRAIDSLGWYYLVRVQRGIRSILDDGPEVAYHSLVPKKGKRWQGPVPAFKKAGWLQGWPVGQW